MADIEVVPQLRPPVTEDSSESFVRIVQEIEVTDDDESMDELPDTRPPAAEIAAKFLAEDASADTGPAGEIAAKFQADDDVNLITATEDSPCAGKASLDQFEPVSFVRVQASGAACDQYVISAGAAPKSVPLFRASVRDTPPDRCCSGGKAKASANRPFAIDVSDYSSRTQVVRILCDQHGSATVESPPGEVIGYITAERVLCSLWFTLRDLHGAAKLVVRGNRFCERQPYGSFRVLLPDESAEVARLERAEGLGGTSTATDYTVEMPEAMGSDIKAMLVAVVMLFDRKLFAQS